MELEQLTTNNALRVSEQFYSIQGEGPSVGVPAYFIRLTGCNLMCGGAGGSLMKEGKATWWCDTEAVWKAGKMKSFDEIYNQIDNEVGWAPILRGDVHIVWTGGEPTLPQHQKGIVGFLRYVEARSGPNTMYNEIETNGTLPLSDDLADVLDQVNCSVKLDNSGNSRDRRIVPQALESIMRHKNYNFKFVISDEADLVEIYHDFVEPYNIPRERIVLMPGVDKRAELAERTRFIFEMAKKYHVRAVSRQHVLAWDKLTGV